MHNTSTATKRSIRVVVLPALVVALGLALMSGVASASTSFQTSASGTMLRGGGTVPSYVACANGAFYCGTANIPGYGTASWNMYPDYYAVQTSCGSTYFATTYFTLLNDPSSTLALYETGNLCGPGLDANGYFKEGGPPGYGAFGHPNSAVGTWSTITSATDCSNIPPPPPEQLAPPCSISTGVFAGMSGSGTDVVQADGAHVAGSYSGTLG